MRKWMIEISVALAIGQCGLLHAEPVAEPPSDSERITVLEEELASLRSQLAYRDPVWSSCDSFEQCNASPTGFYAGAALIIAKLHFKEAYESNTIDVPSGTMFLNPFHYNYEPNVRAWFGYVDESHFGVRAGYGQLEQSAEPMRLTSTPTQFHAAQVLTVIIPASIATNAPGQLLAMDSSLATNYVDLEGTYSCQVAGLNILAGGGLRYARLEQKSTATVSAAGTTLSRLDWSRTFEGVGPTFSVDVRKQLGDTNLAFVGFGRGSMLFGEKTLTRFVSPASGATPPLPNARLNQADEVTPIGDLGMGFEWFRDLPKSRLSSRFTYEAQLWAESGAPTLGYLGFQGFAFQLGWQL